MLFYLRKSIKERRPCSASIRGNVYGWLLPSCSFPESGSCDGVVCDANANCSQASPDKKRQCICLPGWTGNGQSCLGMNTFFSSEHFLIWWWIYLTYLPSRRIFMTCIELKSFWSVLVSSKVFQPGLMPNSSVCLLIPSTDVDECQPFLNNCHKDGECVNTDGSYSCRCRPGFQGDGYNCVCEYLIR